MEHSNSVKKIKKIFGKHKNKSSDKQRDSTDTSYTSSNSSSFIDNSTTKSSMPGTPSSKLSTPLENQSSELHVSSRPLNMPTISPVRSSAYNRNPINNLPNPIKDGSADRVIRVVHTDADGGMDDETDGLEELDEETDDNTTSNNSSHALASKGKSDTVATEVSGNVSDNSNSGKHHKEESHGLLSTIINTLHFKSQNDLSEMVSSVEGSKNTSKLDVSTIPRGGPQTGDSNYSNDSVVGNFDNEGRGSSPVHGINFAPVKESVLNTFGKGNLTLDSFPADSPANNSISLSHSTSFNGSIAPNNNNNILNTNNQNVNNIHPSNYTNPNSASTITGVNTTNTTLQAAAPPLKYTNPIGDTIDGSKVRAMNVFPSARNLAPSAMLTTSSTQTLQTTNMGTTEPNTHREALSITNNDQTQSAPTTTAPPNEEYSENSNANANNSKTNNNAEMDESSLSVATNNGKRKRKNTTMTSTNTANNALSKIFSNHETSSFEESSSSSKVEESRPSLTLTNSTTAAGGSNHPYAFKKSEKAMELYKKLGSKMQSNKTYELFHQSFPSSADDELIIEVFGCAYRKKELLIQGKLFVTNQKICFYSNIVGVVTSFVLPFNKVLDIVKKKTLIFKNSIEFQTLHNKYFFASLLNRDAAFELIFKVWGMTSNGHANAHSDMKLAQDEDEADDPTSDSDIDDDYDPAKPMRKGSTSMLSDGDERDNEESDDEDDEEDDDDEDEYYHGDENGKVSGEGFDDDADTTISDEENMVKEGDDTTGAASGGSEGSSFGDIPVVGPLKHAPTNNGYQAESNDTKIIDEVIPAPVGSVYNLLFGDDVKFIKELLATQKNFNISDIPKMNDKKRFYSYTKPLGGPIGPKQTLCNITEEITKFEPSNCITALQTSETPDVPKGNMFKVQTKIFLSWAANNSTKLFIVTCIVWSGSSFIKGAVEKGAISGQKESLGILVDELKKRIKASGGKLSGGGSGSVKRSKSKSKSQRKKKKNQKSDANSSENANAQGQANDNGGDANGGGIADMLGLKTVSAAVSSVTDIINDMLPGSFTIQNILLFTLLIWFINDKVLHIGGGTNGGSSMGNSTDRYGSGGYGYGYDMSRNNYYYNDQSYRNGQLLERSEYDVWKWINDRNRKLDDEVINYEKVDKKSMRKNVYSDIGEQLKDQEIIEMIQLLDDRRRGLEVSLNKKRTRS